LSAARLRSCDLHDYTSLLQFNCSTSMTHSYSLY